MKHVFKKFLIALPVIAMLCSVLPAQIASASFVPNHFIDDAIFDNPNAMNATQINAFLNGFPNSCISPNRGYAFVDPNGYSPSTGYTFGGNVTAGEAIAHAAAAYDINPQVLLVTLQKERSMVTGASGGCTANAYAAAMGYGCPDSGTVHNYSGVNLYTQWNTTYTTVNDTCVNSASKAGFSQQLIRAAWLLKFGEQRSKGNVGWAVIRGSWNNSDDPQSCYGGPMTQGTFARCPSGGAAYYDGYITIDNVATHMDTGGVAALYWFTPHFHGNQNFSDIFTGWFGDATYGCGPNEPSMPQVVSMYNPRSYDHFYTSYRCEANTVGYGLRYNYEGAVFNTSDPNLAGATPVYRLYNSWSQDHMWTPDTGEANYLQRHGYQLEGVAFYMAPNGAPGTSPVYRLYNPRTYQHVWTTSLSTANYIASQAGFRMEGVAFYSQ